jgi:hypothetical protein
MVCLTNIRVDTLHKGDTGGDCDDDDYDYDDGNDDYEYDYDDMKVLTTAKS